MQLSCKCLAKPFCFSLMSKSLWHWIPRYPGQLSTINTSAKIDMSINWYLETDDDTVTLKIMMLVDPSHCQWFLNFFINNILHLQISFIVHIAFSFVLSMIFLLVGIILLTTRFCTTTSIATVSLSVFWVIFIHPSHFKRRMLVQQHTTLKDCCRYSLQQFSGSFFEF